MSADTSRVRGGWSRVLIQLRVARRGHNQRKRKDIMLSADGAERHYNRLDRGLSDGLSPSHVYMLTYHICIVTIAAAAAVPCVPCSNLCTQRHTHAHITKCPSRRGGVLAHGDLVLVQISGQSIHIVVLERASRAPARVAAEVMYRILFSGPIRGSAGLRAKRNLKVVITIENSFPVVVPNGQQ